MRVGIIQSAYMPWRGYFDFIASVDLFLVFDDVPYPRGRSWRNRNAIKTANGPRWLTIPVPNRSEEHAIDAVRFAPDTDWRRDHRTQLVNALRGAPHVEDALALWDAAAGLPTDFLSELNVALLRGVCAYFGIGTPLRPARELGAQGQKTERLVDLLVKVGATEYLSGPTARGYIDESVFRARGIRLAYKSYDYAEYPQQWGPFLGAVSILDLVANCGPDGKAFLRSRTPDDVVVP